MHCNFFLFDMFEIIISGSDLCLYYRHVPVMVNVSMQSVNYRLETISAIAVEPPLGGSPTFFKESWPPNGVAIIWVF